MPKKKKRLKQGTDFNAWAIKFKGNYFPLDGKSAYDRKAMARVVAEDFKYLIGTDYEIVPVKFTKIK